MHEIDSRYHLFRDGHPRDGGFRRLNIYGYVHIFDPAQPGQRPINGSHIRGSGLYIYQQNHL